EERRSDQRDRLRQPEARPDDRARGDRDERGEAQADVHAGAEGRVRRRPARVRPLRDAELPDAEERHRLDHQPDARAALGALAGGVASWRAWAARTTRPSLHGGPVSCTPTGMPSRSKPARTAQAGTPTRSCGVV